MVLALKKRVPIEVLTLLAINCNILYAFFIPILLISCGDIELNPGPILSFAKAKVVCNADKTKPRIFQLNCRSIVNKRRAINAIVGELPENTIYCFTETWLTSNDHDDFYNPKKDQYVCFRFDRAKEGISKDFAGRSAKTFSNRCIKEFECLQCIKKLSRNKPQGP